MGIVKKDKEKKEEMETTKQEGENVQEKADLPEAEQKESVSQTETAEKFAADVKLKECKYCRMLIPKSAKICPNCKMRLRRTWLWRFLFLLVLAALCAAGTYYYIYVYSAAVPAASSSQTESSTENVGETQEEGTVSVKDEEQELISETEGIQETAAATESSETAEKEDISTNTGVADADTDIIDNSEITQEETAIEIEITEPVVSEEYVFGADGPILDYADDKMIIFHDYFGLFVYDRESDDITGAIDLNAIGCQYTQGDSYCEVTVEADGSKVYLHPIDIEEMYVYDVSKQILTKQQYSDKVLGKAYKLKRTDECVESAPAGFRSYSCAALGKNTYLYLYLENGNDLCYVLEQNGEQLEYGYLYDTWLSKNKQSSASKEEINDGEDASETSETARDEEGNDSINNEAINILDYTEEEFRNLCIRVDYRALLRRQDLYLNAAVKVELTVIEQVDGGLFDDNSYYLCMAEDSKGITRYYIVRDDRPEDAAMILEGDVLQIYGQLFDSCKLPAYLIETQPIVPALTMVYYELLDE